MPETGKIKGGKRGKPTSQEKERRMAEQQGTKSKQVYRNLQDSKIKKGGEEMLQQKEKKQRETSQIFKGRKKPESQPENTS